MTETVIFLPAWYDPDDHDPFDTEARFELDPDNFCDCKPPERLRRQFLDTVPWEAFWSKWRVALQSCLATYLRVKTNGECQLAFAFDDTWMARVSLAAAAKRLGMDEDDVWELSAGTRVRFDKLMCEAYELTMDDIHQDLVDNYNLPDVFGILEEIAAQHGELLRKATEHRQRGMDQTAEHLHKKATQAARAKLALRIAEELKERYTDVTADTCRA